MSDGQLFAKFDARPPADSAAIARCQAQLNFRLPTDYVRFLQQMNGGAGFIGDHYLIAWPVEELVQNNDDYKAQERVPGLFLFGSNGGGEAFAFDTRRASPTVVAVPFIVLCLQDAIEIAPTFAGFLQHLYCAKDLL
jgi:hypothetical protein